MRRLAPMIISYPLVSPMSHVRNGILAIKAFPEKGTADEGRFQPIFNVGYSFDIKGFMYSLTHSSIKNQYYSLHRYEYLFTNA